MVYPAFTSFFRACDIYVDTAAILLPLQRNFMKSEVETLPRVIKWCMMASEYGSSYETSLVNPNIWWKWMNKVIFKILSLLYFPVLLRREEDWYIVDRVWQSICSACWSSIVHYAIW